MDADRDGVDAGDHCRRYPNPSESAAAIREHVKAFGYQAQALRDPKHELVRLTNVTVTPEATLFDGARALVYHGRIDNRNVSLSLERPAATQHDLADALAATLGGMKVREPATQAVGCYIADFVQ